MKFFFLDTSALVKRYHSEKGTAEIDGIFSEDTATKMYSLVNFLHYSPNFHPWL